MPLTSAEVLSWAALRGLTLQPWELDALDALEVCFADYARRMAERLRAQLTKQQTKGKRR